MSVSGSELKQLMKDTAADASAYAAEEFTVTLDQSEASLETVDDLLLQAREKYGQDLHNSKVIFTLCNMFGAYVGEIFRNQYGGTWLYDDADSQAPSVYLQHGKYTFAFAGIIYQRLVNDQTLSVRRYYQEAVKNAVPQQ